MLWLKAFHVIFVITWFAGIFYLPRLFVYHALCSDAISNERFKLMERRLYRGIMTPSAILAVGFGLWILVLGWSAYAHAGWLQIKLVLVIALIGYHLFCGKIVADFAKDANRHSDRFFRWLNEAPLLVLVPVVILAVVKPF
jgi:putative membrane protein